MLTNIHRTVFYTGVCNSLKRKLSEHKNGECEFTAKYQCFCLVYHEEHESYQAAFERAKRLKRWRREWKVELIEKMNPGMKDLSGDVMRG